MPQPKINLNEFADGAFAERVNNALKEVYANIADLNTDPTKKRKVTISMTLSADEQRDLAMVDISVKTTLTPARAIGSKIIIDVDFDGNAVGQELKSNSPGQMMITESGDIANDVGVPIVDEPVLNDDKLIDFRSNRSAKA
ncbi:replication terminator protein [Exiguobacterium sp. S22-S28]|uniref:replication terminator protein n=1 Tax=Exiguobacterium sp. S22-S28 TaxID=3342768 RepID=UPI00372D2B47